MLEMELDLLHERFAVFAELSLSIGSQDGDRFRACDPSLFVPTHLQQLADTAAIREGNHGKRCSHHNAAIEALRLNNQLGSAFCCSGEPVISATQQAGVARRTSLWKALLPCELPALQIAIWIGAAPG